MAELLNSIKAFGEKATGEKIEGDTLFETMKDMGKKMTGKEIKGKNLIDVIDETTEGYEGGSGTKVVTELPQVGEEHIIYELQEKKKIPSLIPSVNQQMVNDGVFSELALFVFVFDTIEDMTNTLTPIIPVEEIPFCLNYIIKEDKLIASIHGGTEWQFAEVTKVSDYKFDLSSVFGGGSSEYLVMLKEYLGKSSEEGEAVKYAGKLLNNELYTFEPNTFGVLLGAPTSGIMVLNHRYEVAEMPVEVPEEYTFEYIPYEKIFKNQLAELTEGMNVLWVFKSNGTGEGTVSSYWIYTNETWFNADEIRKFKFQEKTVRPSTSIQPITPDEGYDGLSKVTVNDVRLQYKRVSATNYDEEITPDTNYDGLRKVTVNAIRLQEKTVSPTTSKQYVTCDVSFTGLRGVTVNAVTRYIDSNIKQENIKKGVSILGVAGTYEGIGATYDVAWLTTTLPSLLTGVCAAQVGGNIYLFGGYNGDSRLDTIYKFDAETETISTLSATLPEKVAYMGVASVGNVYLFGGSGSGLVNTIYKFNTETETITTLTATLPQALSGVGVAAVGSNVYLFGGYNSGYLNTIYKFNVETETITTLTTTLPQALSRVGVAQVGGNIYLFGGSGSKDRVNTIYKFNIETETISTLDVTLPKVLSDMGVAAVGSNVYLFGGSGSSLLSNIIYKFNTETETITTVSGGLGRHVKSMGVASVGNNVYLFGGTISGNMQINNIYKFKVDF